MIIIIIIIIAWSRDSPVEKDDKAAH